MTMLTMTLSEETEQGLHQVAEHLGIDAADLAERAIRQYLRREAEKKIEREETAYREQHEQLLVAYRDQYIAMHEGEVIDHDDDELALYLRVRQQFPLVGILIKHVTPDAEPVWTVRSPRLKRG